LAVLAAAILCRLAATGVFPVSVISAISCSAFRLTQEMPIRFPLDRLVGFDDGTDPFFYELVDFARDVQNVPNRLT
jgi:hypothetical protein